jgi:hypothetical protein
MYPVADPLRLYQVTWVDSTLVNGQIGVDDLPKPTMVDSVGYLVEETKEYITLARDVMGNDWRGVLCIPRCCVDSCIEVGVSASK